MVALVNGLQNVAMPCCHFVSPTIARRSMSPKCFMSNFYVLPQRAAFPAVETGHIEQQAQFSVLPDKSLELGHKVLIVRCCQLPADVNDEKLAAAFFIELNGHSGLCW
jgi:hypothetical protein